MGKKKYNLDQSPPPSPFKCKIYFPCFTIYVLYLNLSDPLKLFGKLYPPAGQQATLNIIINYIAR